MLKPKWTKEKPTKAGWYWYKRGKNKRERIIRVEFVNKLLIVYDNIEMIYQHSTSFEGYWSTENLNDRIPKEYEK